MNRPVHFPSDLPVKILVVDDHPSTAKTLARAIAQLGPNVNVMSATSGKEALEQVKEGAADILITDMIMPEMTGLELIEKLNNHPSGRPTFSFLMTAYEVPGLKVTAQRLKVKEVIVKPALPEHICQIVLRAIEDMNQVAPAPYKDPVLQKAFTILIADDQPDNITLLTRYLENEGYNYIKAIDGLETLAKIRSESPDLVLLDINMPYKDGFAVLEEIRSDPATQHIPIIVLTAARLDPTEIQFGLNMGADDYVTKPFDRRELMARIRTKLRVKEAEDVIRRRAVEQAQLYDSVLQERQRLAAILQSIPEAILVFDSDEHLSLINLAGQKLFANQETQVGQSLNPDAEYETLLPLLEKAKTYRVSSVEEVIWPDKRMFSVSITPSEDGEIITVLHDVTQFAKINQQK